MNKDKQIEEMAKDIEVISNGNYVDFYKTAKILVDKDYRKASEVVEEVIKSVDDMFDRQKYSSRWVDENMEVLGSADIGYAYECWRDYIKDELKRKYIEQSDG